MNNHKNYLTLHEIISSLNGPVGIEVITRKYSKHLLPGTRGFGRERLLDPASYSVGHINTHLRIFDLITDAIYEGNIEFYEDYDAQFLEDSPLECPVDFDSFFSWLRNNPEQETLLITLLGALDREFPAHWQKIIDSGKLPRTQNPREKMWQEILVYAKKYFSNPAGTTAGFRRDDKTKNILRRYKAKPSVDTFERRLRKAEIIIKRVRSKAKK